MRFSSIEVSHGFQNHCLHGDLCRKVYDLEKCLKKLLICDTNRLYSGNFPPGFFSHIFIDECGHSMEPSALVAIAGLQGPESKPSQVVISGDPKQLGPIVRSPVALAMGLGTHFTFIWIVIVLMAAICD
jgi:AAA domain